MKEARDHQLPQVLDLSSIICQIVRLVMMLPYSFTTAPPSEPEGWDAADILELTNPVTKRWSCPTMTLRNRRCENVVSQGRSIQVTTMINNMAIQDARVVVRDENRELTNLARGMLCPRHVSDDKAAGVVALWKNHIKTWMRAQAQAQPQGVKYTPRAPEAAYQPNSAPAGPPPRYTHIPLEQTAKTHDVQIRQTVSTVLDTSLSLTQSPTSHPVTPPPVTPPQPPPPPSSTYGATFDADALRQLMTKFTRLTDEIQTLKDANRRLRDENAWIADKERETAAEHRRTRRELDEVEEECNVLAEQVDEQYGEINELRAREDRHLERIAALEGAAEKSGRAYRRRERAPAVASARVVRKEDDYEDEDEDDG
ncbi:hypothetical protein KVR01_003842 [Diaporthe batatas]|uniref:uncharacterized protein n=1 Tax=Diaporthe batatas TaxID=748121 RepID=UPI001D04812E|nr:uncharacterized protein KVR01_003842 [Diaporthe batatas]KAG8168153.1 hypothetical protein KVR01_003842 [Diaporthe batatas]